MYSKTCYALECFRQSDAYSIYFNSLICNISLSYLVISVSGNCRMTLAQHINKSNKSIKLPVLSFHTDNNSLIFFSKGRDYTRPALLCNTQMNIYVKVIAYFRLWIRKKLLTVESSQSCTSLLLFLI